MSEVTDVKKIISFLFLFLFSVCLCAGESDFFLKYGNIKSFKAEFVQYFTSGITRKSGEAENGTVYYMKPDFIRFDYRKDQKTARQVFVDGEHIVTVNHEKEAVLKKKKDGDLSSYMVFLKGVEEIKKGFEVTPSKRNLAKKVGIRIGDKEDIFKLKPKRKIPNVRLIFLIVSEGKVNSVVIVDPTSNINQLIFKNSEYNPKVNKKAFTPSIPQGYHVSVF